ncbi:MAG: hypothetical protein EXS16_03260 [Gemmataceae bacterium]|nr:hypothetical protein [Gemmataceae bacterium]
MIVMRRPFLSAMLVAGVIASAATEVRAQYNYNPYVAYYYQAQLNQQAWMARQMWAAQATRGYFNANPQAYLNSGTYGQAYLPPIGPTDPYGSMGNPYSSTSPGYGIGGAGLLNPYNPYSHYYDTYGTMGQADLLRAYGSTVNSSEQARILRKQALQARLDTKKKAFEIEAYIKANTPTAAQERERIEKLTLKRMQTASLPGEISRGKAVNYLVNDLRKHLKNKTTIEPIVLTETVLGHLNVTKNHVGLGILRDNGRVTWPTALTEKLTLEQQRTWDRVLQAAVMNTYNGKADVPAVRDQQAQFKEMRRELIDRANEISTAHYSEARRFLNEVIQAQTALEKGEAVWQAKYQHFIGGRKPIQDVVEFLIDNALNVGPAGPTDESEYRAIYAAVANFDIAMEAQRKE